MRFKSHVEALNKYIKECGNPFEEESQDLLTLTTKDIVNPPAIDTIKNISQNRKQQYEKFVKERFVQKTTALNEPIPQNRYILFKQHIPKTTSKGMVKLQAARNDRKLFSKLHIRCQNCNGNLNEFFQMKIRLAHHLLQMLASYDLELSPKCLIV